MTLIPIDRGLTDDDLDRIEQVCDAATPGLQEPGAAPGWCWSKHHELELYRVERCNALAAWFHRKEDARFVATSRTVVPALIAAVRSARAELAHAVAENLAFNIKVAEEINAARASRDEALRQLGQWQVDLERATGNANDGVIAAIAEQNRLRTERDTLATALTEALDAWDGFMRRANPGHEDPRDAHARELRKLVSP